MLDIVAHDLPPALAVPFGLVEKGFVRLTKFVGTLSQEALEYRGPAGDINSTASLINHLALIDLEYLHRIMGKEVPADLEQAYGPYNDENGKLPQVVGKTADELLSNYQRVIDMARDYLKTQTDADAEREVHIPWWSESATVRYVLWHMAGHSMFHQGQMARLRDWQKQQA